MKILFLLFLIFILFSDAFAQIKNSSKATEPEFKNQGEYEDLWAKQIFKNQYKSERYKKIKDQIASAGNYYNYGKVVIGVGKILPLKAILNEGLFYPLVMTKAFRYESIKYIKPISDSLPPMLNRAELSSDQKLFIRADTLWIQNFEEIKFAETTPKKRRFRFWLYTNGFANPTVYFMELTNNKAISTTDLLSFTRGSKLTFFKQGWVII